MLAAAMPFLLAACNVENEPEEEHIEEEVEIPSFEDNLDFEFDEKTDFEGETYIKVEELCFDVNINPIGDVTFKTYRPEDGVQNKGILTELWQDGVVTMTLTYPNQPEFENTKVEAIDAFVEDFNGDSYEDIATIVKYYTTDGEIYWATVFYGNEHGAMTSSTALNKAINDDLADYNRATVEKSITNHADLMVD